MDEAINTITPAPKRKSRGNSGKKPPAPSSPLNEELKVIRRVARALEGLPAQAQDRVLGFVANSVQQVRLSRSLNEQLSTPMYAGKETPWIER